MTRRVRHWRIVMLPWLVTFHVTRLGFEAQNAAAFCFLRLVGNASRIKADEIISDTIAPPLDSPPSAIKAPTILRLSMPLGPIAGGQSPLPAVLSHAFHVEGC